MYKIQTLNSISDSGLNQLTPPEFEVSSDINEPHGIILRSYNMNEMELPKSLLAVARAGAGVNNIPIEECAKHGIVVFNTPVQMPTPSRSSSSRRCCFRPAKSPKASPGQRR